MDSLRGQLLLAGATLPDPNFARTVVLVCEHSDDGALGLVLNRPGELVVGESAPELAGLAGDGSEIEDLVDETLRTRVFAGYAGWGPGQLDAELEREDWFVEPAGIEDIFNPDADVLWARVLA